MMLPNKVECVFPIDLVSILHHAGIGRNGHGEGAPRFIRIENLKLKFQKAFKPRDFVFQSYYTENCHQG